MDAFSTANWVALFSAVLGASAALTGLLFVGFSINVASIVADPDLHRRALQPIIVLFVLLLAAVFILAPGQPIELLGAELIVLGVVAEIAVSSIHYGTGRTYLKVMPRRFLLFVGISHVAIVPYIVAGTCLVTHSGWGLFWLIPAVVVSFGIAIVSGWVWLVEINPQIGTR